MKKLASDVAVPKPLTFAMLRLLTDGEFHSGELLAQQTGVTRASVSNALRDVSQYGLELYSVRGRGYRLVNPVQWLESARISSYLASDAADFHIEILDSAPSSNTLLLQRASQGAPNGSVLAVEWHSGGRGRLGRPWYSGLGSSLTFSLLWRFDCGTSGLAGLSLATGLALVRALNSLGVKGVKLKWPNDLLGAGGKVAGILIEAQGDMLGPSAVVIGIGMNLRIPPQITELVDQPVSALTQLTNELPPRNLLMAEILRELARAMRQFSEGGFASLREDWESHHLYQNQQAQLLLPDGNIVRGVVRGVTEEGALMVEMQSAENGAPGIRIFHAGEISLRSDKYVAI